jgi:hypothetical protein
MLMEKPLKRYRNSRMEFREFFVFDNKAFLRASTH